MMSTMICDPIASKESGNAEQRQRHLSRCISLPYWGTRTHLTGEWRRHQRLSKL